MTSAKNNGKRFVKFLEDLLKLYINKKKGLINDKNENIILGNSPHRKSIKNGNGKCCSSK